MDIEADRKVDKHKGTRIQIWLNDKHIEKLNCLASLTRKTRTRVIRDLLDGQDLSKTPDKSCRDAVAQLGRIGGLMKIHRIGTQKQISDLFNIVKDLRKKIYGDHIA